MLKVLRNLKQSWISVIIIVLLLIVQAACDLTLPDYTSKIINVGIQNGGIEEVSPNVIRKSTIDDLLIFTQNDYIISSSYEEITKESVGEKQYENIKKQYPALENETLYKIKKLNNEEKEKLNSQLVKPLMIIGYLNNEQMSIQIKEQMLLNVPDQQKQQMSNMKLVEIVRQMPQEKLQTMFAKIDEQLENMEDSILEQAAIQEVKQEYKAMGVNTDNLQNTYIIISGLKMLGISLVIMVSAIFIMLLDRKSVV